MVTLGTLGAFGAPGGTTQEREGTFAHELGHTFGLLHGGSSTDQYKPNYHSIMNYAWQYPTSCNKKGWRLNYSDKEFLTLDERSLSEPDGIGGHTGHTTFAGPLTAGALCDSAHPTLPNARLVQEFGPVDWNGDGDEADINVQQDINNFNPSIPPAPADTLTGYEDWSHLNYHFREQANFTPGIHVHGDGGLENLPLALLQHNVMEVLGNAIVISDGETTASATTNTDFGALSVGDGATSTFTIVNRGNIELNLTGDPVVELDGPNTDDFTVTTVPASVVPGFDATTTFELRFHPSSPGSKTATVRIANDAIDDFDKNPYDFVVAGVGNM